MKYIFIFLLILNIGLPSHATDRNTTIGIPSATIDKNLAATRNSVIHIFMDTNYGAIVSRYNLKVSGIEMPQMYGYKYVSLAVAPGDYLIESHRDGVGGTSLTLKVGAGEKHYIYIDPVGFPRPTPNLRIVDEARGADGVRKSTEVTLPENTVALLARKGIGVATDQTLPPRRTNTSPRRRALVIGNDKYQSISKLANAREDAATIAANLTGLGYEVSLRLDLSEKEMKAALRTFSSQVQGGDEIVFFFAGHGVQLGTANYLLPTDIVGDSEAQVRDEAIQLQRVLEDMSERKAKFTLAIIDACRDNPFRTTGRAIGGRGLAPTTAATGQMVIFSAGVGQQALDRLGSGDKNKNSVFTRIFVQEMQKSEDSIDRVMRTVRNQVADLAKSVGHEQVPAIYDQVLGDFYFKKK